MTLRLKLIQVDEDFVEAFNRQVDDMVPFLMFNQPWNKAMDNLNTLMENVPHDFTLQDSEGERVGLHSPLLDKSGSELLKMLVRKGEKTSELPFPVSKASLEAVRELIYFNFLAKNYSLENQIEIILICDYLLMPKFANWMAYKSVQRLRTFTMVQDVRNELQYVSEHVRLPLISFVVPSSSLTIG